MVLRLGAVSGVGHARLIFERFGGFWGSFGVIDLFLLQRFADRSSRLRSASLGVQQMKMCRRIKSNITDGALRASDDTAIFRLAR